MKSGYVSYKIYLFSGKVPRKGERRLKGKGKRMKEHSA
jgi:hypothetical protein